MRTALFLALLFIFFIACRHYENQHYEVPNFTLPDVYGININLYSLLDHGPVVFVPWALWTKICIKELDAFKPYEDSLHILNIQMLAISQDRARSMDYVLPFAESHGWVSHYTILLDTANIVRDLYDIDAMPSTIAIDMDGNIVLCHQGYKPGDEITIVDSLKAIFGN